jgi:hypothetical protein
MISAHFFRLIQSIAQGGARSGASACTTKQMI